MAKEEKLRIFELFRKGVTVPEVAKTCKTPERTLYRWFREYQDSLTMQPIKEAVKEVKVQVEKELNDIDFQDDWVNVATKQSISHCLVNGKIAEELSTILLNEIQQPDINYRAVSALSSSINVHSRLHREYGMFYLLDPNIALKKLESEGFEVSNPSDPIPREDIDLSGMSPEELAREYKKLIGVT